ncbi:MAG: cell division protein FtsK, partial [Micromonosporaceae bacterium]|nr:cell division protein FtsK [Micromonosporaceae bacterium]
ANQIVRMPEAGDRTAWNHLLETMTEAWTSQNGQRCPPRVFDGDAVPLLDEAPGFLSLKRDADGVTPIALLGDAIDVTARSAAIALPRTPGRNLAVLGTACAEARSILDSAARSLARQHEPGTARFSVGWFDRAPHPGATTLTEVLPPDTRWVGQDDLVELLRETTQALKAGETTPHFLLLYAVDAASQHLAVRAPQGTGHEMLRKVLAFGPEQGTHVLGWWRSVARLRDDLGGITARFDAIGSWVALNVHGGDLSPLSPAGPPTWYPRPWRALFFDRGTHRGAEVIVPYRETT